MRHSGRGNKGKKIGTYLALLAAGLGCLPEPLWAGGLLQFNRPGNAARPAGDLISPRATVSWSIVSLAGGKQTPVMAGESIIGPNGALLLGPYGSAIVAGMTVAQAQIAVEKQVARDVKNPRVVLKLIKSNSTVAGEGWGAMTPTRVVPVTYDAAAAAALPPVHEEPQEPTVSVPSAPLRAELGAPTLLMAPPALEVPIPGDTAPSTTAVELPPPVPSRPSVPGPTALPTEARPASTPAGAPRRSSVASEWRPLSRPGPVTRPGVVHTNWDGSPPHAVSAVPRLPTGATTAEPPSENIDKAPRVMQPSMGGAVPISEGEAMHGEAGHPPVPRECSKMPLPVYVIEPPDILLVQSTKSLPNQPVQNQHLVRPDGRISLGIYGEVPVAGLSIEDAKVAVYGLLTKRIEKLKLDDISVDVLAYNSKWYYVITDGGGYGEQVQRFPFTGSETVLDAISQIQGLPPVASRHHIWLARPACSPYASADRVLPINYISVTQCADHLTNYQVMPGDRIYVQAEAIITIDSTIAKVISPIERLFGVTLLGSTTVNSFRRGGNNNNNNNNNR